jgi:hypothetical protein
VLQLARIKARMAEWKRRYPNTYHETYVSLNLVKRAHGESIIKC